MNDPLVSAPDIESAPDVEASRLRAEIDERNAALKDAARSVAAPPQRVDPTRDRLRRVARQYGLLLVPVAVLLALKPRATLRVATQAWAAWMWWQRARGAPAGPGPRRRDPGPLGR